MSDKSACGNSDASKSSDKRQHMYENLLDCPRQKLTIQILHRLPPHLQSHSTIPNNLSGSFDCLDTKFSTDPVRVALYNSNEKLIWSSAPGAAEGSFSRRGSGKHWLCLENGLTYEQNDDMNNRRKSSPRQRVTRTIGFSLRIKKASGGGGSESAKDGGKNDIDGTTQRLIELANNLNENFQVLMDHMSFMKARETVHRELHEATFTSVVRWNILEICAVVVITFGQILNVWWILNNRRSY